MNILDDLKIQYKLGGIANRLIYWNVGCFLVSAIDLGQTRNLSLYI